MEVGYTTGVFDLFHIGHLNILKNAGKKCDYLIVGVTSDEEAFRKKGKYPIIPFAERLEIVNSIVHVDRAVEEDDTNKKLAWEAYKFDKIFKGSDWEGTELWNAYENYFGKRGVEVVYFPYTKGTSSTKLREVLDQVMG